MRDKAGRHDVDEERREDEADGDDEAAAEYQHRQSLVRELARPVLTVGGEGTGKDRYEGGGERALREQLPRKVCERVGYKEGVQLARRAEERRREHFTDEPQHAAHEGTGHHTHRMEDHAG